MNFSDFPPDVQAAATECADMIAASEAPGVTFRMAVETQVARAIMAERDRREPLTVAVSVVVAEAETLAMTMRRRSIFNALKAEYAAIRNPPIISTPAS